MLSRRRFALAASAVGPLLATPGIARAQAGYPARSIRIIVANAPGGTDDAISRRVADKLSSEFRQPVVVENRGGGATTIGGYSVVRAQPDGYTLLCLTTSGIVQTVLRKNLQYRLRDFAPVAGVGGFPMALTLASSTKATSIDDVRALARAGDGLTFASGGVGTMGHLAAVRFLSELEGRGTHVSYRNNPEGLQALAGGFTQMMFPSVSEVESLRAEGYIRVLAVTSAERARNLPDVPTMRELGFPSINPQLWHGFMAPAGTPAQIVAQLSAAISKAIMDPSVLEHFTPNGFQPDVRTGAALDEFLNAEATRWGKVITDNNIQITD